MTDVANAFPRRPLRITGTGAPSALLPFGIALALLAATIVLAIWTTPAFVRDWGIMQNPVVVPNAQIRRAKCTTRKLFFVDCEADIAYTVDGQRYSDSRSIFFFDMHSGSYSSSVVRSATRPQDATLSMAIDYFWSRVALVAVVGGLMVLGVGAGFLTGSRNLRMGRATSSEAGEVQAVPVELTEAKKGWFGRSAFSFKAPVAGKVRKFTSRFGKGEEPFATADGTCWAAIPAGSPTAILLDRDLARLDLSDDERGRIWAAASGHVPAAA